MLEAVQATKELVELPVIAGGGIHSEADARVLLRASASAVQLDSLLFVDPHAAGEIAAAFPVA